MDEHVVHQEIGETIHRNANSNKESEIVTVHHSKHDAQPTGNGENQKESIILLKNVVVRLMVIFVQNPQKPMHHILVRRPGHEFHEEKSSNYNEGVDEPVHSQIECLVLNKSENAEKSNLRQK